MKTKKSVKLICPHCGKEFYRTESYLQQYGKYTPCCSRACSAANGKEQRMAGTVKDRPTRPCTADADKRLPHVMAKIRITKPIELYPELCPVVGQVYTAEKYGRPTSYGTTGYVIESGGKRINIRITECEEV